MVEIETGRFYLRELVPDDATPRYLAWFADAVAARYIAAAAATTNLPRLRDYIRQRTGREDVLFLGIFDRTSREHIGNIKYEPVDSAAGYAVMGILVGDPAYRGKGVGPEVLEATTRWLKTHRRIRQVLLGVTSDNAAAIRAYEAVGFAAEPTPYLPPPGEGNVTMVLHL